MKNTRSLKQKLARVLTLWADKQHDQALRHVEELLESWPGNAQLYILWASLVQLQEEPTHTLEEAKRALQCAVDVDETSPAGTVELGHFLDAVEDNPQAAYKAFSDGILAARRLLMDGLLGQARVLLQLDRRKEAIGCLIESLHLSKSDSSSPKAKSADIVPDILLRDPAGPMLRLQLKGPFAQEIGELLKDAVANGGAKRKVALKAR